MIGQGIGAKGPNELMWIGGYCLLPLVCVVLALLLLNGCSTIQRDPPPEVWDDMKRQGKFEPQHQTDLYMFADHRDSRRPPEGAISRENSEDDTPFYTGMQGEMYVGRSPVQFTPELARQGQTKFNIYCTPCHDKQGLGQGIVPQHVPTWQPANLTDDRIVEAADGDLFNVITNGRRSMPAYRFQVAVEDRWAIIAYVRVLQRAAHASMADVPDAEKAEVK